MNMSLFLRRLTLVTACASLFFFSKTTQAQKMLPVGYNIGIQSITLDTMQVSKAAGVDCIEISFSAFIDKKTREFTKSEAEILEVVHTAKKAAEEAGVTIYSVHMPYSQFIDISLTNEQDRQAVIDLHKKVLEYCRILNPKIILFHPSWYLGLNEREARKQSLIKSATELNESVKSIHATMVIENMLGPHLLVGKAGKYERPLCRTVEETVEIMDRLPKDIYSAIDMNHIKHPENLILAMGKRLKHVHIADGDGEAERHYFPCSGKGENDWNAILGALDQVGYSGVFLFESKPETVADYKPCYTNLFQAYLNSK